MFVFSCFCGFKPLSLIVTNKGLSKQSFSIVSKQKPPTSELSNDFISGKVSQIVKL